MRRFSPFSLIIIIILTFSSFTSKQSDGQTISPKVLRDKIAGGWAGKMIGVTYGAPVEFRAQGNTFEDSIKWTPKDIRGSMW